MSPRSTGIVAAVVAATFFSFSVAAYAECVPGELKDGWLLEQESKGGHTVDRHVAKSDAWLIDRLHKEPNIPAASSFPDRVTARKVIGLALQPDKSDLDYWATKANGGEVAEIRMAFEQPIGRLVPRGSAAAIPAHGLRLFVMADGAGSCHLLTAYPTTHR
ncbi:MAG: hypothetical protein NXI18_14150 [Alphaproteobacteria bacterium]|nr:hypothetical protein [Alphaproteobacteria bacterium]